MEGNQIRHCIEGCFRQWAEDNVATTVMIETIEAARHAEEILSVEDIDGCVIGPVDPALSMGVSRRDISPGAEHVNTRMMSRRHISRRPQVTYYHEGDSS